MVVAGSGIALFTTCYVYAMEIIGGYWATFIGNFHFSSACFDPLQKLKEPISGRSF